jgi:hypothetical protein
MRKFFLVAAIALLSTASYAGPSRSLSLAAADAQSTVPQEKPPAADTPAIAPLQQTKAPATADTPRHTETRKPVKRSGITEARIIYELHRHGIYW